MSNTTRQGHIYSIGPSEPDDQAVLDRALPEFKNPEESTIKQFELLSHTQVSVRQQSTSNEAVILARQGWSTMPANPLGYIPGDNLNFDFSTPTPYTWPGVQSSFFPAPQSVLPHGAPVVTDPWSLGIDNVVATSGFLTTIQGGTNTQGDDIPQSSWFNPQFSGECGTLDFSNPNLENNLSGPSRLQADLLTRMIPTPELLALPPPDQGANSPTSQLHQTAQGNQGIIGPTHDIVDPFRVNQDQSRESNPGVVCYGMIVGIPGTVKRADLDETSRCPVRFSSPESFIGTEDPNLRGEVGLESRYLTSALLLEPDFELQVTCTVSVEPPRVLSTGKRLRVAGAVPRCTIDIILYGPSELSEAIYTFIQECNEMLEELQEEQRLYLQDPVGCDRDVPYRNPQRLPPLDTASVTLTSELAQRVDNPVDLEDIEPRPELLELLDSQEDLPETPQPHGITTPLERHQKQALTFMQQREQGWAFDGARPDIWEAVETGGGQITFVNRISDARQVDEPPPFYGGIIADPMGLGKTLTMIALIMSDFHSSAFEDPSLLLNIQGEESCGLTLIVVPPALLGTWEDELATHVSRGALPWRLHHAKSRLKDPSELEEIALVLTTYHTVSIEGRTANSRESSMLFKTRWRRVVLDEAHLIRNSDSLMARAVCSLNSASRWAVTGTPIQNHINDLAALLKFLGVHPYSEKRVFDADISHVWKFGNADAAVKRLKRLAGCLLLRRPKGIIQLPERHDQALYVEFSSQERELYDQVRTQVIARIDESLTYGSQVASFVSILQQIEAMRMICNLGLLYPNRHDMSNQSSKTPDMEDWHNLAQRGFNLRFDMGPIQCHSCSFALDTTSNPIGEADLTDSLFARCWRFICPTCVKKTSKKLNSLSCGHVPPCPIASVSASPSKLEEPPVLLTLGSLGDSAYRPTKVTALIKDLKSLPSNVKCVVFSTWRMTLDVLEAGLRGADISAIRFDGKVPQRERQGVIDQFRKDPSIRVMLLTLSCGAVGLTLTVASRAYLMEPHWNPTIEDQALARIHRIGQKQNVTTLRFYVKNSFEEKVVENQQSKRDLASILLAPSGVPISDRGHLERLRDLI
ncbi:SNF2 family N-terminal domain-containing protein [Lasiosphaeria hispida]|uniref:SNF2 family N-terminal domain-containing protein n=1 Tax=Lasiosphaeria hispida TaxID=260671 RepID=A0AAJ0HA41_9PEZI|nr:SNF2 family N-terminal domain-containing protein [Lasiosphaeria hispida]